MDREDIAICENCGLEFDMSDLEQVIAHLHEVTYSLPLDLNIKGKRKEGD